MKSIVITYPDFQELPRGLKQLLVATESFFFREAKPHRLTVAREGEAMFEHFQRMMNDQNRRSLFPKRSPGESQHWQLAE